MPEKRLVSLLLQLVCTLAVCAAFGARAASTPDSAVPERPAFGVLYTAWIDAGEPWATVRIRLTRHPEWVRWVRLEVDPERYRDIKGSGTITREGTHLKWAPPSGDAYLQYRVSLESRRASGTFDGRVTADWALFRGEDLAPVVRVDVEDGTQSQAKLRLNVPDGWSIESIYPRYASGRLKIDNPRNIFDRPSGWFLLGKTGVRRDTIGHTRIAIGAPVGEGLRRMDILALFRWTVPTLQQIFPDFPERLLVVGAGDPMWRGALSGPSSLYVHTERPLLSENGTSTFLHELVHVAMRARSEPGADWIVEGLAEYYSLEALRRSGTLGERRFERAHHDLAEWAARAAGPLDAASSAGATTARAVGVLRRLDAEIRTASGGRHSLDDVAAELASDRRRVSLELLRASAERFAGRPLATLSAVSLSAPPPAP